MSTTGKRVDKLTYDKLVRAYIEKPGVYAYAALQAGVSAITAKLYWEKGQPKKGMPPIKIAIDEYHIAQRAALERDLQAKAKAEAEANQLAREHAVKQRATEGNLADLAQQQLSPLMNTVTLLGRRTLQFVIDPRSADPKNPGAGIALRMLETELAKLEVWDLYDRALLGGNKTVAKPEFARPAMTLDQIMKHMTRLTHLAEHLNNAVRQSQEIIRLHLGQPTDIIAITDDLNALSPEEYQARLASVRAALEAAATPTGAPELRVVEGGKK